MPKSRAELVRRAWALLIKPSDGETPEAADLKLIDDLVEPVVAQLATSYIIQIGNPNEIDEQVFIPVAAYLANEAAPEFAQSKSDEARALAERDIARATVRLATSRPLQTDYF